MSKILSPEEEFFLAFTNIVHLEHQEDLRAYYDDNGKIWTFAASSYPPGNNWISIDRKLYETHEWSHLYVIDGKIVEIKPTYNYYFTLAKSNRGVKVVKNHACIILEDHEDHPNFEYYDNRNS